MNNVTTNENESALCDSIVQTKYNVIVAGICATLALFGLVYTFFGYRCFKAVMFLSGLIFGGTTVYLLCQEERIFQEIVSLEIAAGISVAIGILCGLITMLIRYIGLFLQGFFLGVLVAFAGILALQSVYHPSTAWIPVGILFGTGIIFSLLTLKYQKQFMIIGTAVFGSVLITATVDYFLEDFLLMRYAWEALMANPSFTVCWYTWVIVAIWPTLSFSGILVQWKVTAKGYDHTDVILPRGRRKQVRTHLVRPHRNPPTNSNPRSTQAAPAPVNLSAVAGRRPGQRVSAVDSHQRSAAVADHRQLRVDVLDEGEPPSYFECVELGVGEPVRRSSYHAPAQPAAPRQVSRPPRVQSDLVQQITSSQGYAVESAEQPSRGYVAVAQARVHAQRRPINPNHEPIEQFSRSARPKPPQGRNKPDASRRARPSGRRYRVSPSDGASGSQGDRSDTQRLLSDPPRALSNREAIAAHAQRVLAVQNRRLSGQVHSSREPSPHS